MKSFYEMWASLEDYRDVDADAEAAGRDSLNMTARLPMPKYKDIFGSIRKLTRGFHLNTIIGRMLQPWVAGLDYAPRRWDLYEKSGKKEDVYKWSVSEKDTHANNNYKAAYSLFKQELANAVQALPDKRGLDVRTQRATDVLAPTKRFFRSVRAEEADLIDSMRKAYEIFDTVFGPHYNSQARNFANFFEIVVDEFMRYKEMLPAMGDDQEDDKADNEYVQALRQEIARYIQLEKQFD